jgi:hypothetical protein
MAIKELVHDTLLQVRSAGYEVVDSGAIISRIANRSRFVNPDRFDEDLATALRANVIKELP